MVLDVVSDINVSVWSENYRSASRSCETKISARLVRLSSTSMQDEVIVKPLSANLCLFDASGGGQGFKCQIVGFDCKGLKSKRYDHFACDFDVDQPTDFLKLDLGRIYGFLREIGIMKEEYSLN